MPEEELGSQSPVTASRNVAFKARKVRDSISMEDQDRFIMRELDDAEVGLGEDCEEVLAVQIQVEVVQASTVAL